MKNKFNIGDTVRHVDSTRRVVVGEIVIRNISASALTANDLMYKGEAGCWHYESDLEIVKPTRKITLYRYTYKYYDYETLSQSNWTERTNFSGCANRIVFKTETKEIEVDCD